MRFYNYYEDILNTLIFCSLNQLFYLVNCVVFSILSKQWELYAEQGCCAKTKCNGREGCNRGINSGADLYVCAVTSGYSSKNNNNSGID